MATLFLPLLGLAAVACVRVGEGQLHVQNDLSGLGRNNTFLQAFAPEPGDVWPPAGFLNLWVRGDDFGRPPAYGMNGYLFLVRTSAACPMTEAGPEVFGLDEVTVTAVITVREGSVDQFVTVRDEPGVRLSTWALVEIGEFPDTGGGHFIHRCGTVTWSP
jgi:hypothetical protein